MATGFIYVIPSVGAGYQQASLAAVPCFFEGRIYFGPCKRPMRPRMREGDYVFGISPSRAFPRRVVYAGRIAKRMTFAEAYGRFPGLHGPRGPIHVQPAARPGLAFPESNYRHIPGSIHDTDWIKDIATPGLDAFFVLEKAAGAKGAWLGRAGPAIKTEILEFLKGCSVHGSVGPLSKRNDQATETAPVRYRKLYRGLHLETSTPEKLMALVLACVGAIPARASTTASESWRRDYVCGPNNKRNRAPTPRKKRRVC